MASSHSSCHDQSLLWIATTPGHLLECGLKLPPCHFHPRAMANFFDPFSCPSRKISIAHAMFHGEPVLRFPPCCLVLFSLHEAKVAS